MHRTTGFHLYVDIAFVTEDERSGRGRHRRSPERDAEGGPVRSGDEHYGLCLAFALSHYQSPSLDSRYLPSLQLRPTCFLVTATKNSTEDHCGQSNRGTSTSSRLRRLCRSRIQPTLSDARYVFLSLSLVTYPQRRYCSDQSSTSAPSSSSTLFLFLSVCIIELGDRDR